MLTLRAKSSLDDDDEDEDEEAATTGRRCRRRRLFSDPRSGFKDADDEVGDGEEEGADAAARDLPPPLDDEVAAAASSRWVPASCANEKASTTATADGDETISFRRRRVHVAAAQPTGERRDRRAMLDDFRCLFLTPAETVESIAHGCMMREA